MGKVKEFLIPQNEQVLKESLEGNYVLLAGGTHIGRRISTLEVDKIISLRDLGWDKIEEDKKYYKIGAMVSISELLKDQKEKRYFGGLLYQAARDIGSSLNRNMVTVGGNITTVFPWSDLPVAFLILDGEVVTLDGETEGLADFWKEMQRFVDFHQQG